MLPTESTESPPIRRPLPSPLLFQAADVAKAHGLTRLARETALNRENMYRILSEEGNPQLSSLKALLDSLELKLSIEPKRAVA